MDEHKLTDEEIQDELEKRSGEAKELLQDKDKMEHFLIRLERKMTKVPLVGNQLSYIPMLVSLVRAYVKKEYTEIPLGSMIAIVGGLLYFLSPIDLIPDVIPGVGYLDDAAVVLGAIKLVQDDVNEYKEWRRKNGYSEFSEDINCQDFPRKKKHNKR